MKSIAMAAQNITLGVRDIMVAGGMESMTNAPYFLRKMRSGTCAPCFFTLTPWEHDPYSILSKSARLFTFVPAAGAGFGHVTAEDLVLADGLTDAYGRMHMGVRRHGREDAALERAVR